MRITAKRKRKKGNPTFRFMDKPDEYSMFCCNKDIRYGFENRANRIGDLM